MNPMMDEPEEMVGQLSFASGLPHSPEEFEPTEFQRFTQEQNH